MSKFVLAQLELLTQLWAVLATKNLNLCKFRQAGKNWKKAGKDGSKQCWEIYLYR